MQWNQLWKRPARPRSAAFTDIDNTYIRAGCEEDSRALWKRLNELDMPLIAVTGARFTSVHRRIQSGELPPFPVVASSVGTDIRVLVDSNLTYQVDETWQARMTAGGFDQHHGAIQALRELVSRLAHERPEWRVVVQPGEAEAFKFSLHYDARDLSEAARIAAELAGPCVGLRTLWCYDINSPEGRKRYCFDVLGADKADAVSYLTQVMELAGGLVGGDSGNDFRMITETPDNLLGVVVGGATPELMEAITKFDSRHRHKRLFVDHPSARRGPQSLAVALEQLHTGR